MMNAEKETIIRWDEEQKRVSVYSCRPGVWAKAKRAGWKQTGECRDRAGRVVAREFEGPLALFRFRFIDEDSRKRNRERGLRAAATRLGSSGATPVRGL